MDTNRDSNMPKVVRYNPTPESHMSQALRTADQPGSSSEGVKARVLRERLEVHRDELLGALGERLSELIQVLQMRKVLVHWEVDQLRCQLHRPNKAVFLLLDMISGKNDTNLTMFINVLKAECPQAHALLNEPESKPRVADIQPQSTADMLSVAENSKDALEQCLNSTQHNLPMFFNVLKSGLAKGLDISLVIFENGFNLLHQLIFLDREDLLLSLQYAGIWRTLCDQPTVCSSGQYANLTPMDLALKLKRNKFRDALSRINKNEISLYEIERCVREGNVTQFRELAECFIKRVKSKPPEENSLLEYACQSGSVLMLQEVIDMEKEKLPCKRTSVNKALAQCVSLGLHDLIKTLLEYLPVDINQVLVDGKSLTEHAASNGDTTTFRYLESFGAMPRDSVIALAAANNRLSFLHDLLNGLNGRGYNINFQDKRGKSAARFAAERCYAEVVELLLAKGLDLSLKDKRGFSILHAAASGGSLPTVEVVLQACEQQNCLTNILNSRDRYLGPERCFLVRGRDNEQPAWHYVEANRGVIDIFQRRTQGGSVDVAHYGIVIKSGWGSNPSAETIQEVERRYDALYADPNAPLDMQALHVAIIKRREEVALKLIDVIDNVSQPDRFGLTPLHLAAMQGSLSVIKALLEKGVSKMVTDEVGHTPEDIARANDHPAAVTALTTVAHQGTSDVRQILSDALQKLSEENVNRHQSHGQNPKLYIKMILRDVVADINEYLYDHLGEGPIASETRPDNTGLHNGPL